MWKHTLKHIIQGHTKIYSVSIFLTRGIFGIRDMRSVKLGQSCAILWPIKRGLTLAPLLIDIASGKPRITSVRDDNRILLPVRQNRTLNSSRIKIAVGIEASKSTKTSP